MDYIKIPANVAKVLKLKAASKVVIYDNGGESFDRYTVIIDKDVFGMSENPNSPQGFNQYIGEIGKDIKPGKHLGKKLSKIPKEIQKAIKKRQN